MAPLHHPNLVRLYGAVWNEGPDKLCLVLEYVEGGSMRGVLVPGLKGITWNIEGFGLAHGVAKCMHYLHHELRDPVMHRDLKPDNILVDTQHWLPKASVGVMYLIIIENFQQILRLHLL